MFTIMNKAATLVFWGLVLTAVIQGWTGVAGWLPMIGLVVAGIHVLEVLFFLAAFRSKSTNLRLDAIQVFVFGMFHLQRFMPKK